MRVIIVGAGKLGQKLAESMINEDIEITIIDNNPSVIDRINEHFDCMTVVGNGIDISILRNLDIATCDLLVACTDSDETNTVICTLAKKLGCKSTIARIRNIEYKEQLDFIKKEMGIDQIVNPDLATATVIETYLLKSFNFYSGDFADGRIQMVDFNIGAADDFVGKKLKELKNFQSLLIAAISRNGEIIIPYGDTELEAYDTIYVIGKTNDISKLGKVLNDDASNRKIQKVMIFGGSNISIFLTKKLVEKGISVTIIEQDIARCQELSEILDGALIIQGDGTDIHLLEEEQIEKMDAFIGLSGMDETNLLMALMAKQTGVPKVISKISRPNYNKIIDKLDIDAAFNPVFITASSILKFVRGGKVISVSLLLGGNAEVVELVVAEGAAITGKPLEQLKLPEGIIIGAIVHGKEVIIPNGKSVIHENDRIISFCLSKDVNMLKSLVKPSQGNIFTDFWNRH